MTEDATFSSIFSMKNTVASSSQSESGTPVPAVHPPAVPWLQLETRIHEGLAQHNYYVANSEDLSLLWRGERIDLSERRRRISVFAAQHQWRVETRPDGTTARFQIAPASGFFSREILSRNHE